MGGMLRRRGSLVLGLAVSEPETFGAANASLAASELALKTVLSAPFSGLLVPEQPLLMIAPPPTEQALKKTPPDSAGLASLIFTPKFLGMWLMILNSAVSGISIAGAPGSLRGL